MFSKVGKTVAKIVIKFLISDIISDIIFQTNKILRRFPFLWFCSAKPEKCWYVQSNWSINYQCTQPSYLKNLLSEKSVGNMFRKSIVADDLRKVTNFTKYLYSNFVQVYDYLVKVSVEWK